MKRRSSAHRPSSSRRSLLRPCGGGGGGFCEVLKRVVMMMLLVCFVLGEVAGCDSVENGESSSKESFFADSDSFSFPSTLTALCSGGEENCPGQGTGAAPTSDGSSGWRVGATTAFRLSNGGVVSCSLASAVDVIHDGLSSGEKDNVEKMAFCKAPVVPDVWMRTSSGMTDSSLDGHGQDIDSGLLDGSSAPHVEISPPLLDWGEVSLYSPSMVTLTVKNTHNDSYLHIYEPFSTDQQFYAFGFESLLLEPGESASISFVFLPRFLGSSLSQLVLQTNFGGFIIQAKGSSTESSYRIEPLVDMDIQFDGRLNRNLSLHNPFNDVLYVEEVSVWVSSSGDTNQSVHVVCGIDASHYSSSSSDAFLTDRDWFRANSGVVGLPQLDLRPHKQWELPPKSTKSILELTLWSHLEGLVYGAICFKLRNSTLDGMNMVIVPVELNVQGRTSYKDPTGLLSAYFEPILPFNEKESIVNIFLRNEATYSVRVVNISEITEKTKLFKIKYMRGLVLFPRTVTQISMVRCTPSTDPNIILPHESFGCKVSITTNKSIDSVIDIPCQDFLLGCCSGQYGSGLIAPEVSYVGLSHKEKENSRSAKAVSSGSIVEASNYSKKKLLEVADELVLKNWRSEGTNNISLLEEHELLFPVVQMGSQFPKWISVRNPSQQAVIVQLMLNSLEIIDQCKCTDELSEPSFSSRFTKTGTVETRIGFSIPDSGITEAIIRPSESVVFGPVLFRPSNRCMWRSSALLRNNLSGVEWLPLLGFGGSHLLVLVEDAEPVWKLEFGFDLPMNPNLSSNFSNNFETPRPMCNHRVSKEIYAKNMGELPLEVKKLKVSGTDCSLDGFMIHRCEGFLLEPGESMRLLVSYQADFSTAVINRNLELAMTTGIFVIPMRADIPVHMLNFCRKSFFRMHWKVFVPIIAALSTLVLMLIRILPHSFVLSTQEYYFTVDNNIRTVSKAGKGSRHRHSTKVPRSVVNDEKPEAGFIHKYPISQTTVLDGPKRTLGKRNFENSKEITSSMPTVTNKHVEAVCSPNISEPPQNGDLTVKVVKEKGRRRKRKAAGAGLAGKLEASSSQSGNSTPSSPLSPNASYPKQLWLLSPANADIPFAALPSEQKHRKQKDAEVSSAVRVPDAEKQGERPLLMYAKEQPPVAQKVPERPSPLPLATSQVYPSAASSVASPSLLTSYSPIAPHARAPGPKFSKEKSTKIEKNDVVGKEFTYDIWGNHFPENFWGVPKEVITKMPDASEGDSRSFFSREPQSLVMMPSARLGSPGLKLPSDDVTSLDQMK